MTQRAQWMSAGLHCSSPKMRRQGSSSSLRHERNGFQETQEVRERATKNSYSLINKRKILSQSLFFQLHQSLP
ncbi:hypothetical protein FOPG_19947 [Fusarium oxysporum f. sp. conglutinans race 2 54008]|uniref:Uncharacterized protein n=1 Tax=Fusarium oxysporum f. sp. conglutinans race 2 54008 TaxID=1089457 RepID=X0GV53_FUSOX|nr:hypothetical protein FOPG_19947 [Fusarium oxysporum f. sp. conglutinans race 2 54008]